MDETLQELENELKRLPPRHLSAGLMTALERELGPVAVSVPVVAPRPAKPSRSWQWVAWSLAAAATIMVVAVFQMRKQTQPPQAQPLSVAASAPVGQPAPVAPTPNRYEPVGATSVLYDLTEDGAATLPDKTEERQVRYRYVDTYTWQNPQTKASLRWSVPRDEVRVIHASLD